MHEFIKLNKNLFLRGLLQLLLNMRAGNFWPNWQATRLELKFPAVFFIMNEQEMVSKHLLDLIMFIE